MTGRGKNSQSASAVAASQKERLSAGSAPGSTQEVGFVKQTSTVFMSIEPIDLWTHLYQNHCDPRREFNIDQSLKFRYPDIVRVNVMNDPGLRQRLDLAVHFKNEVAVTKFLMTSELSVYTR